MPMHVHTWPDAAGVFEVNRRVVPNLLIFDASGIAGDMAGKGTLWLAGVRPCALKYDCNRRHLFPPSPGGVRDLLMFVWLCACGACGACACIQRTLSRSASGAPRPPPHQRPPPPQRPSTKGTQVFRMFSFQYFQIHKSSQWLVLQYFQIHGSSEWLVLQYFQIHRSSTWLVLQHFQMQGSSKGWLLQYFQIYKSKSQVSKPEIVCLAMGLILSLQ